jgi:hypothetical protein
MSVTNGRFLTDGESYEPCCPDMEYITDSVGHEDCRNHLGKPFHIITWQAPLYAPELAVKKVYAPLLIFDVEKCPFCGAKLAKVDMLGVA